MSLEEITCVNFFSESGSPRLAIHTPRRLPHIVKLQFSSDTLLEEWQAQFATTCGTIQNALGKGH